MVRESLAGAGGRMWRKTNGKSLEEHGEKRSDEEENMRFKRNRSKGWLERG